MISSRYSKLKCRHFLYFSWLEGRGHDKTTSNWGLFYKSLTQISHQYHSDVLALRNNEAQPKSALMIALHDKVSIWMNFPGIDLEHYWFDFIRISFSRCRLLQLILSCMLSLQDRVMKFRVFTLKTCVHPKPCLFWTVSNGKGSRLKTFGEALVCVEL